MAINTPSLTYKSSIEHWNMLNALWGGTPSMRESGKTYLPQRTNESDAAYKLRKSETSLDNYLFTAINNLSNKVFQTPLMLDDSMVETDWWSNYDMCGNSIDEFYKNVLVYAMLHGVTFVLADSTGSFDFENLADQRSSDQRPFCTHVKADQLIGVSLVRQDGVDILSSIRIQESVVVDKNDYEQEIVDQIRLIARKQDDDGNLIDGCRYELHRAGDNGEAYNLFESGDMDFDEIPLLALYTNRTGYFQGESYFKTMAYLNIDHWQSSSYQRNILNVARIPRMYGFGFTADEIKSFEKHGVANGVFSTNDKATTGWNEAKGESIQHGERDLAKLEEKMERLSLDPVLKQANRTDVATIANIEQNKSNSVLESWAMGLQETINSANNLMYELSGIQTKSNVKVNDDYSIVSDVDTRMKELREARAQGDLSKETYLREGVRIGFFDRDLDIDVELERTSIEQGGLID